MEKMKLYLADIRTLEGREAEGMELLTPQRRCRAEAMADREERLHCIAAGLLLRRVLKASDEELCAGQYGKPEMKDERAHFNLSHGGNYAALAVFGSSVGVDVEPIGKDVPEVPEFVFTKKELEWFRLEPSPQRFAVLWTRLESALKAGGTGFEGCDRAYSVFDGDCPRHIETFMHDGHVISCAAGEAFEVQVETLSAEELILA